MCVSVAVFGVVFVYSVVIQQSSTSIDLPQNQYDGCVSSGSSIQNDESVNSVVIEGTRVQQYFVRSCEVASTHFLWCSNVVY